MKKVNIVRKESRFFLYVETKKGKALIGITNTLKEAKEFLASNDAEDLINLAIYAHKRNCETGNNYGKAFYECGYDGDRQTEFTNYYLYNYGLYV